MKTKAFILGFALISAPLAAISADAQPAPAAPAEAPKAPTPVPAARGPALDLSIEAARAAIDACTAKEQKVAVSVIDSAGVLKVLLAADGTSPRGVQSSTNKALTTLAFKAPTSQLSEQAKTDKALADKIAANPSYLARAGGILIKVNDEIIGAVGVGGARGSEKDEDCAITGLQKVQSRLQ